MSQLRTHYDNLQVKETASDEVIKGAYRFLCQKWHPDKNPNNRQEAERILKIINQAYAVLSDPVRRREHDEWIAKQRECEFDSEHIPPPSGGPQDYSRRDDSAAQKSSKNKHYYSNEDVSSERFNSGFVASVPRHQSTNFSLRLADLVGSKSAAYLILLASPYCIALVCICLYLNWPLASALYVWMPIVERLNTSFNLRISNNPVAFYVLAGIIYLHHEYIHAELYVEGGFRAHSVKFKADREVTERQKQEIKFLKKTYASHIRYKYRKFHRTNVILHAAVIAVCALLIDFKSIDNKWLILIFVIAALTCLVGVLRVNDMSRKEQIKFLERNGHI